MKKKDKGPKPTNFSIQYDPTDNIGVPLAKAIVGGAKVILVHAGVRSSKSHSAVAEALKQIYLYKKKPNLGWFVSPTYDQSCVLERKFVDFCMTPSGSLIAKHIASKRKYLLYPPPGMEGSYYEVEFKTAIEPQHLRGYSVAWIVLDEAAAMKRGSDVFTVCQARVMDCGGIIIIASSPMGQNWLYHDVYLRCKSDPLWISIGASSYGNKYLDPAEIARLEQQLKSKSEALARQEIYGSFEAFEGRVFNQFTVDDNVVKSFSIPDGVPIFCGIDWGQNDPFVCVWVAEVDGAYFVVDEYYRAHGLNHEHYNYISNHPLANRVRRYWCDPSNAQQYREFKAMGLNNLVKARRPKQDSKMEWPVMRARLINQLFSLRVKAPFPKDIENPYSSDYCPRLSFFETIRHGLKEVTSLAYENITEAVKDANNQVIGYRVTNKFGEEIDHNAKERIEDKNNHFVDALGYCIFSECRVGNMHPFYYDQNTGEKVVLTKKEKLQDTHKKMMREQIWDAIRSARSPRAKNRPEPWDPLFRLDK